MGTMWKRAGALLLALALVLGTAGQEAPVRAAAKDATESVVTVSPFDGQWKYYGQSRDFILDVNYATSDDKPLPEGVALKVDSEKAGVHKYRIEDERSDEEKAKVSYQLEKDAPTYEIREYTTAAEVEPDSHIYNIEDREAAAGEDGTPAVSGSAAAAGNGMKKTIEAPKGYLIAPSLEEGTSWESSMEVELKEGENTVTYYLCSNQKDETRKAVDQTPKTITLRADWTAPKILSLSAGGNSTDVSADGAITSSEAGTFYYAVVPQSHAELSKEEIALNVGAHYGIVGYGRVDGTEKASDFSFQGLMANNQYTIYAYMEDEAGNCSEVWKSESFTTDNMALEGTVEISGTMAVDQTLTAKATLSSVNPGELSYQWYRLKEPEDASSIDEVWDETGGAEEDDLEASDEDDEDDEDEDEDEDEEGDIVELSAVRKLAEDSDDEVSLDGAVLIKDAVQPTYKATREDIGYRLACRVTAEKYSGQAVGESTTFIPKLIPEYKLPTVAAAVYSPKYKLSSIRLPERWSWVDNTIVPVHGNSGYRAKYVPENTAVYKTIIVRVIVPVNKRTLKKSMIAVPKKKAYAGKAIKNNFYVEDEENELTPKLDFKVTYKNNKNPGKASITFRGIGNYKGTVKVSYQIKKRSVKSLSCRYGKTAVYSGKNKTPGVAVKNGDVRLVKKRDYTIEYKNNKEMGRASITIRGKGNYRGKRVLHFNIVPAKPKVSRAVRKGKTIKLKFKGNSLIKGYYVYVSTARKFKKDKTNQYILAGDKFNIGKMAKGTYYIRIRGYGVKKGKTYLSGYSGIRKVRIKK